MTDCKLIKVKDFLSLEKKCVRLIDIRSHQEHQRERISIAECIPLAEISRDRFENDEVVVFHCQSGNRTRQAQATFDKLGLKEMYILDGGMNAWKQASQSVEVDSKAPFPIMRQVQIVVGFMVVLGVFLSYIISPYFNFLSAFFGAGLLFAGLSGYCGLANILMLLPCNKPKT